MPVAYLGLGSNLGDGQENLARAWAEVGQIPGVVTLRLSSPYRTAPMGMDSTQWFTNAAAEIETSLPPIELLGHLMRIERGMGRDRGLGRDRRIDLDLLLYGEAILETPELTLPHPGLPERLFVLAPLAEIAPDLVHPVLRKTMRALRGGLAVVQGQQVRQETWETSAP